MYIPLRGRPEIRNALIPDGVGNDNDDYTQDPSLGTCHKTCSLNMLLWRFEHAHQSECKSARRTLFARAMQWMRPPVEPQCFEAAVDPYVTTD